MTAAKLRIYIDSALTVICAMVLMAAPIVAYQIIGEHPARLPVVAALTLLGVYAPPIAAFGLFADYRALRRVRAIEAAEKVQRECAALEDMYRRAEP